ncbi:Hsp20/alpha crystallin family protein [Patescibacteria group bacterium]|nr:Hsp20/alpha crystallin family protein [Patescibacteria group bacterium]
MNLLLTKLASDRDDVAKKDFGVDAYWSSVIGEEGQLAIDVYETKDSYVVNSTIAGVKVDSLDISVNNDMLTIKGERVKKKDNESEIIAYLYQECFWGKFSRSIILPKDVVLSKIKASLEDGVLTVVLPMNTKVKETIIRVREV